MRIRFALLAISMTTAAHAASVVGLPSAPSPSAGFAAAPTVAVTAQDRPFARGASNGAARGTASRPASAMSGAIDPVLALKLDPASPYPGYPTVFGGLLGLLLVLVANAARQPRRAMSGPLIDVDFEARAPLIAATEPTRGALDPLRHFHPAAPPVTPSRVEVSRPDYVRINDTLEVWTPAKVDAARAPASNARRRATDAAGTDYRFHRLTAEGSVKSAERRTFVTDRDAQRFAETLRDGAAVEVWRGNCRLATIEPDFVS